MSQSSSSNASVLRILLVAVPLSLACSALTYYWSQSLEDTARTKLEQNVLENMLSSIRSIKKQSTFSTVDANHDMVADTPEDSGDLQQPEKLIFSYIAEEGGDQETEDGRWDALVSAIAASTGKPLEVKQYQQVAAQLEALREGEVHILGLGTGAAPLAVQTAGFVPLCTMANADGDVGYTMMLLTAADSGIQDLAGVKGHRVVFVRPTSNSGFKAAFVQLYDDAGLLPERDYEWSFSLSHQSSVHDVLSGEADVAPVASDILAKMVEQGEVEESQYRVLYKSEAFPPAVIGCAYNLPAEMIEQIRSTLIGFDWSGTGLEEQFGPMGAAKFVGVNYKDDWANIRRIDDAVESLADRP